MMRFPNGSTHWESHRMRIEFKPQYFDDLNDIREYITINFNDELSKNIVQKIYDDCLWLAEQPFIGREYPRNHYFRFLIVEKKNVVFYHIEDDVLTLHRIFDSRRDYVDALNSEVSE